MTDKIKEFSLSQEIENEIEEKYKKKLKIVECLNEFEKLLNPKFKQPLAISKKYIDIVFEHIKNKIEYIEEILAKDKPFDSICLMIYKHLFIGDEKLKYDNLDEKVNDFKLILECLNGTLDSDKEKGYIKTVIGSEGKNDWKKLLKVNSLSNTGCSLLIAVVIKFSEKNEQIVKILIEILKAKYINNFEVKFNLNILKDISVKNIANDFIKLFNDDTEYFDLVYQDGQIKKIYNNELAIKDLNFNDEQDKNHQKEKKKEKKEKRKRK